MGSAALGARAGDKALGEIFTDGNMGWGQPGRGVATAAVQASGATTTKELAEWWAAGGAAEAAAAVAAAGVEAAGVAAGADGALTYAAGDPMQGVAVAGAGQQGN